MLAAILGILRRMKAFVNSSKWRCRMGKCLSKIVVTDRPTAHKKGHPKVAIYCRILAACGVGRGVGLTGRLQREAQQL
jgi:hypothetical protein